MQSFTHKLATDGLYLENEPVRSWLNLKDIRAKYYWEPTSAYALSKFIEHNTDSYIILGNTSNILLDNFPGVMIRMNKLDQVEISNNLVIAQAGVSNRALVSKCVNSGICGFEFIYTIPGTIGGSVYMNAGAHSGSIGNQVAWVEVIDCKTGKLLILDSTEISFSYRNSSLQGRYIIVRVALKGIQIDKFKSMQKIRSMEEYINNVQPRQNTLGSAFKNPDSIPAWKLLSQLDPDDLTSENVYFSELHRNFLINKGNATYREVMDLINKVQAKVKDIYDISLELEIKTLPSQNNYMRWGG